MILDKVLEPLDQVYVAAVCQEWWSVAKDHNNSTQRWRPKFEVVSLPPLPRLGSFLSRKNDNTKLKVVLSAVPNLDRDNFVVVAFYINEKSKIAFFKGGQKH